MAAFQKYSSREKLSRLREELVGSADPHAIQLGHRLSECGVQWKGRYRCRSVGCPRCTRNHITQQQRKARWFFKGADNIDMAFMTVVLGGTCRLDDAAALIEATDKANRYRIGACRDSSTRWNDFAMWGSFEIDALGADHYPLLAPERLALLREIAPVLTGEAGPTWVPTYHALVHVGSLGVGEVQSEFAKTWSVPGQVHVQPFEMVRSVDENINRLVSYCCKGRFETRIPTTGPNGMHGCIRESWPTAWQVDLVTWLHHRRSAFEFLRFTVSPAGYRRSVRRINQESMSTNVHEPMPILF